MAKSKVYILLNPQNSFLEAYSNKKLLYNRLVSLSQEALLSYPQFSAVLKNTNEIYLLSRFIKSQKYCGPNYQIYSCILNNSSDILLEKSIITEDSELSSLSTQDLDGAPKVMVIDFHNLYVDAITTIIKTSKDKIKVCATSNDPKDAISTLENVDIDIIVISIQSLEDEFMEVIRYLKRNFPNVAILVRLHSLEKQLVNKLFEKEVEGILSREADSSEFLMALNQLINKSKYYSLKVIKVKEIDR